MRRINILTAILLSIVTLGIYYLVLVYRNSKDIHEGNPNGFGQWKLMFWLGFVTFGITWIVLIIMNWLKFREMAMQRGVADETMFIMSLVLVFVVSPVGAIVWAVTWNQALDRMGVTAPAGAMKPVATRI